MTETTSYRSVRLWAAILSVAAAASMVYALYLVFFWVPTEAQQGIVQRIYYVHVPSAWTGMLAFAILALNSIGYLWLKDDRLDAIAVSAGELGLVLMTGCLITGPLWGRIAWGAWWQWDARLTFTLLLWLIYISYFVIRNSVENPEKGKRYAAILGIVGAVDLPIIHMSVQWFRTIHPQPVVLRPEGPTADPQITQTLLISFLAFLLAFFALLLYRYGLERLTTQVEALRYAGLNRAPTTTAEGALP